MAWEICMMKRGRIDWVQQTEG